MAYPLIEKTYFATKNEAWCFAQMIGALKHWGVTDYGYEEGKNEPYFVETINHPFASESELSKLIQARTA